MPKLKKEEKSGSLKGWQQIAAFLGQPVSVAERWAHAGMPVERRGRNVYASCEDLRRWLSLESAGEPVQIANEDIDLSAELKRGLTYVRRLSKKSKPGRAA